MQAAYLAGSQRTKSVCTQGPATQVPSKYQQCSYCLFLLGGHKCEYAKVNVRSFVLPCPVHICSVSIERLIHMHSCLLRTIHIVFGGADIADNNDVPSPNSPFIYPIAKPGEHRVLLCAFG